mgnify:CR=1 FL=1
MMRKDNDWSTLGCKDFWEEDAKKQREKERLRLKKKVNCVVYFRDKAIEKTMHRLSANFYEGEDND